MATYRQTSYIIALAMQHGMSTHYINDTWSATQRRKNKNAKSTFKRFSKGSTTIARLKLSTRSSKNKN